MNRLVNRRLSLFFTSAPVTCDLDSGLLLLKRVGSLAVAICVLFPVAMRGEVPSFPGIPANRTVSVASFGANGSDNLDATAAIQRAIDSVSSQGGGTVTFPAGTYIVNSAPGNGYAGAIWMKSHVRLLGVGGRQSILKMPAGSRTDPLDRYARQNCSVIMIGDPAYLIQTTPPVVNPTKWQDDVEIAYLGFDLDNGGGRRAIQMRYATRNVRIHHCEGFQSGIERGEVSQEGLVKDNHFFNLASFGAPIDLGIQPNWVDVSQNITVDNNVVRGFLQLTADGGSGIKNLWIHHNKVYDAQEFGIAITFSGPTDTIMEDLLIEDNEIIYPGGAGIVVWPNYIGGDMDLSKIKTQALRRVTIRRNTILLRPVTYPGQASASGRNSAGIGFGAFLTDTRDIRIEDNQLTAENPQKLSNSRQAFRMTSWDLNWMQRSRNQHAGAAPTIAASGFNSSTKIINLAGHGLFTGVQVQLSPVGSIALPSGIDPYRSYRLVRIDDNHFSLAQLSGELVAFSPALAGGSYLLVVSPTAENFILANNKIIGSWDWDAYFSMQTKNLRIYGNLFCSRFVFSCSHEDLSFFSNESTGTLSFAGSTLRNSRFYDNSWSVVESSDAPYYGSAICTFGPVSDPWRGIEATFESNRFSFVSVDPTHAVSAVSMMPENWTGSGALRICTNQFVTPAALNWAVAPKFLTEFDESEFTTSRLSLMTNSGFESPAVGANNYHAFAYNPSSPGWSFKGYAGISGNQSGFTSANTDAPEGAQVAVIQQQGSMEQVVELTPGTYVLSAFAAQRATWQQAQTILVSIDSEQVGSFLPAGSAYTLAMTKAFTVASGSHTIRFTGQSPLDQTAFLDKISLQPTLPLVNSGFESPKLAQSGWTTSLYRPPYVTGVQPWDFQGNAGVTGHNSGFTQSNPNTPEGAQVAFIQTDDAIISRSITVPESRSYILSVAAAQRGNHNLAEQTVNVFLDGNAIGAITPHGVDYKLFSIPFTTTAGVHQLKFTGTTAVDSTAFLDQVIIY